MNYTRNVIKRNSSKVVFHSFEKRTLNHCLGPFLTLEGHNLNKPKSTKYQEA